MMRRAKTLRLEKTRNPGGEVLEAQKNTSGQFVEPVHPTDFKGANCRWKKLTDHPQEIELNSWAEFFRPNNLLMVPLYLAACR
jgi:hypothetical protein